MGTLNVIRYDLERKENEILWSLSTGQDNPWNEGKVTYVSNHRHRIIFQAIKGSGVGDIALVSFAKVDCCKWEKLFENLLLF